VSHNPTTGEGMVFCLATSFSPVDQLVPLARAADEHGYHAVAMSDHVVNPVETRSTYPYTEDGGRRWEMGTPWPDPWVSIGAMAAATERVRFFTNVYILPARTPFATAKAVGTAAVLSGNRVALGVGMGWMEEEFDVLEQDFRRRGRRADEALEVIAALLTGEVVEHHGEFYDFGPLEMLPAPSEPVPVWVGGMSDAALRRAARNDGWISDLHTTEEIVEIRAKIDGFRREYGREHLPFAMVCSSVDAVDLDGYRRLEEVGVTHLLTMPWVFYGGFTDDLDQRLAGTARFAEDILARW
jgi:probable F420-dependent oxidoreductase